eukprot:TRINITY_DN2423_c0_g1_i1.p1 TRINITY_DN2423_c0_g1~~TRINITY_DN2423_c0_g1_i1.p1  ORF type:complete len:325 (+),score=83.89 TRINITY_DN2423_c0_g1_i1:85-1059(+)
MEQEWANFLTDFKVKELLSSDFELHRIQKDGSILDALKLLIKHRISSLPIYDSASKTYCGFIDILDIVAVVVMLSESKDLIDSIARGEVDWQKFMDQELKVLQISKVQEVTNASLRNPWCEVYEDFPLRSLMDMFGQDVNLHRVAVGSGEGRILGVVSQSRVIQFLAEKADRLPARASQAIRDVAWQKRPVFSVNLKERAIEAFKMMLEKGVSGLAVVGDNGRLVGNISASDLKGSLEANLFADLYLPIGTYLEKATEAFPKKYSEKPISCTESNTLRDAIVTLNQHHVHRVFVVDPNSSPIGVFSLCDLITFLNHPPDTLINS